jgi:hypothetical protein
VPGAGPAIAEAIVGRRGGKLTLQNRSPKAKPLVEEGLCGRRSYSSRLQHGLTPQRRAIRDRNE